MDSRDSQTSDLSLFFHPLAREALDARRPVELREVPQDLLQAQRPSLLPLVRSIHRASKLIRQRPPRDLVEDVVTDLCGPQLSSYRF